MKYILSIVLFCICAVSATASDFSFEYLTVTTTATNAATAVSDSVRIKGYIEEIIVDVVTPGTTGNVSIVAIPEISTFGSVSLYTNNACAADANARPRFYSTDTLGVSITNSAPENLFLSIGDNIQFTIDSGSATSTTFNAVIKYSKTK